MNGSKIVWVELEPENPHIRVIRIFRTRKAMLAKSGFNAQISYSTAVGNIRHQLWIRCGGFCEMCGDIVTEKSGHMHEVQWRGKGGEISLENSLFICAKTHTGQHKDRAPQFSRRKP